MSSTLNSKPIEVDLAERRRDWIHRLNAEQRATVLTRNWIVSEFERALSVGRANGLHDPESTAAFIRYMEAMRVGGFDRSTLANWRRAKRIDGLFGLIDARWLRSKPQADWHFIRALSDLWRKSDGRPLEWAHYEAMKLAEDYDWPRCLFRESCRWARQQLTATAGGDG